MKFKIPPYVSNIGLLVTFFIASSAMAGFDITRMTTVVDDFSGSYTVTKSGRIDDGVFTGTSLTEFNQFHPGIADSEPTLTGVIATSVTRSEGLLTTISDGEFNLQRAESTLRVSFENLVVSISEGEVSLVGTVSVNDETIDANELPDLLAAVLRRVFWLTRR